MCNAVFQTGRIERKLETSRVYVRAKPETPVGETSTWQPFGIVSNIRCCLVSSVILLFQAIHILCCRFGNSWGLSPCSLSLIHPSEQFISSSSRPYFSLPQLMQPATKASAPRSHSSYSESAAPSYAPCPTIPPSPSFSPYSSSSLPDPQTATYDAQY